MRSNQPEKLKIVIRIILFTLTSNIYDEKSTVHLFNFKL